MYEVKMPRSWYQKNDHIYRCRKLSIYPGMTVLTGCNGYGKSTFMHILKEDCKRWEVPYKCYDNEHDGGGHATSWMLEIGKMNEAIQDWTSSEGEKITNNISRIAPDLGRFCRSAADNTGVAVVCFDGVDSGASIDSIVQFKQQLIKTMLDHASTIGLELYIVVSANSYEMARGERCVDVHTGKYKNFRTYDQYRKFIMKSRTIKDTRYGIEPFIEED